MDVRQARESILYAREAQRRARMDVSLSWLPLLLYAAFAVVAISMPRYTGQGQFLWLLAAPVVTGLAAGYAFRYGHERGIEGRSLTWVALPIGLLALALGLGALAFRSGQPGIARFLPSLVVALGYLILAWFQRNLTIAAAGSVVLLASVGMVAFRGDPELSEAVLALAYVLALLAARIGYRGPMPRVR